MIYLLAGEPLCVLKSGVLGLFTYLFFSKLLGYANNSKFTLSIFISFFVFIDYILLKNVFGQIFVKNASASLQSYFFYFAEVLLSQICITILVSLMFKGDLYKKLALCTVYFVVCELVAYGIVPIITRIWDLNISPAASGISEVIFDLLSLLQLFLTCGLLYFISKRCDNLIYAMPKKLSLTLFFPSLLILLLLEFVVLLCNEIQVFHLLYLVGLAPDCAFIYQIMDVFVIFIFATFGLICDLILVFGINNTMKELLADNQLKMQLAHYRELEAGSQKLQNIRHDMKNHMLAISGLLEQNDLFALKTYTSELYVESGILGNDIQTGNSAVDALINAKALTAQNSNISFTYDIKIPKLSYLSDFDLSVIFGNALDNAIEACQRMNSNQYKFVSITADVVKSYFIIEVKNTTDEESINTNSLVSKKSEKGSHGIGLHNMEAVVLKNLGILDIELVNHVFSLSLMLPIDQL